MKADLSPVSPAFRTDRAAFAFASLILFLVGLPFVFILCQWCFPKENIYATGPTNWANYDFLYKEIYEKSSDVDILFIGSSRVWYGIDTPLMQSELSLLTGHKKSVLTFGYGGGWRADFGYFLLKELLARRRVRLVVMQAPGLRINYPNWPHPYGDTWLAFKDWDMLVGLTPLQVFSSYAQADINTLHFVLNLLRKNHIWRGTTPAEKVLGARISRHAYGAGPAEGLQEFCPSPPTLPIPDHQVYSMHAKSFSFSSEQLSKYQLLFLKRILNLLRIHHTPAVLVYFPKLDEALSAKKTECSVEFSTSKIEINGIPVDLIQFPNELLFGSLSHKQIELLYTDDDHLNANGNMYFTKAISGNIIHAYQQATEQN